MESLYGRQVVLEALRAGRRTLHRLRVAAGARDAGTAAEARRLAQARGLSVEAADRRDLDRATHSGHHQGLVLEAGPFAYAELADALEAARSAGEPPFLLLLDHIEDPQNVGSLMRTAEAAGVHGIVLPKDRAAPVTPAVSRASSGAAEHLLVARVANLVHAMGELKRAGVWIYGLDATPGTPLYSEVRLDGPVGLVVGSEGGGMSRLVRARCDGGMRLPMRGRVGSLNAAVSGAIALYHVRRLRDRGAAGA